MAIKNARMSGKSVSLSASKTAARKAPSRSLLAAAASKKLARKAVAVLGVQALVRGRKATASAQTVRKKVVKTLKNAFPSAFKGTTSTAALKVISRPGRKVAVAVTRRKPAARALKRAA